MLSFYLISRIFKISLFSILNLLKYLTLRTISAEHEKQYYDLGARFADGLKKRTSGYEGKMLLNNELGG